DDEEPRLSGDRQRLGWLVRPEERPELLDGGQHDADRAEQRKPFGGPGHEETPLPPVFRPPLAAASPQPTAAAARTTPVTSENDQARSVWTTAAGISALTTKAAANAAPATPIFQRSGENLTRMSTTSPATNAAGMNSVPSAVSPTIVVAIPSRTANAPNGGSVRASNTAMIATSIVASSMVVVASISRTPGSASAGGFSARMKAIRPSAAHAPPPDVRSSAAPGSRLSSFGSPPSAAIDQISSSLAPGPSVRKAIRRPSGDQAGPMSSVGSVVRRCSPLPSAPITKMSWPPPPGRQALKAIRRPSGDQVAPQVYPCSKVS